MFTWLSFRQRSKQLEHLVRLRTLYIWRYSSCVNPLNPWNSWTEQKIFCISFSFSHHYLSTGIIFHLPGHFFVKNSPPSSLSRPQWNSEALKRFVWLIDSTFIVSWPIRTSLTLLSIRMLRGTRWMVSYPASEFSNGPLSVQLTRLLFSAKGAKVHHNCSNIWNNRYRNHELLRDEPQQ